MPIDYTCTNRLNIKNHIIFMMETNLWNPILKLIKKLKRSFKNTSCIFLFFDFNFIFSTMIVSLVTCIKSDLNAILSLCVPKCIVLYKIPIV